MTEALSDPEFYSLMIGILAVGFAGLLTVILWPLRLAPTDRGGFQ